MAGPRSSRLWGRALPPLPAPGGARCSSARDRVPLSPRPASPKPPSHVTSPHPVCVLESQTRTPQRDAWLPGLGRGVGGRRARVALSARFSVVLRRRRPVTAHPSKPVGCTAPGGALPETVGLGDSDVSAPLTCFNRGATLTTEPTLGRGPLFFPLESAVNMKAALRVSPPC